MKKHKGLKILIIVLSILIVLVIATLALLYVFTDLFKTNKQLFAKYIASMTNEKTAFFTTSLQEYKNKKQITPYENSGSITANINALQTSNSSSSIATDSTVQINNMLKYGNDTRINFSGKVDVANNRDEQDINIFYNNDVSLPFKYKHVGDYYALQADFVLPNYIGIENNNIPELLQKLGINVTTSAQIPSKLEIQELQSLQLSEEEITHLINNYVTPVLESLSEDKFTKTKNQDNSVSYNITLTMEEIKNIAIQELQTLSQDTVIINKINSIYQEISNSTENLITSEIINNIIANLQEYNTEDGEVSITITQINGKVNKIEFIFPTSVSTNMSLGTENTTNKDIYETTFTITKDETASNLTYNIDLLLDNGEQQSSAEIEMSYNNINTNSVVENHSITTTINDIVNMKYNFSNNVVFANSVGIVDFDLNNTIILNNYKQEDIQIFLSQLGPIIAKKNEEQMQEIGYPTELINPIFLWAAGPALSIYSYNMTSGALLENNNLSNMQVTSYNQQFLQYEGTRTGAQVRTLVNVINTHNTSTTNPSEQIQITTEDYGEGGTLPAPTTMLGSNQSPALVTGKNYKVTFAYDPTTGYITACGITEVASESENNSLNAIIDNSSVVSNGIVNSSLQN